ncbi:hypothetical protein [Nocardia sp. SSK8]|uniref:hypothetical protein n=1 Tax=Nocardia sp. SSK8 TaxID=3120154 RepID=UPI003008140E
MSVPSDALQAPKADELVSDDFAFWVGGNFLSPAYGVSALIKKFTNFDVFGWASEQVAGDWEAVSRASGAVSNLGKFNAAFAQSINDEWGKGLESTWQGNSAQAAETYFKRLASSINWQVTSLDEVSRTLDNIGGSMANLKRALGDLLQEIADLGIILAAELAVAAIPVGVTTAVSSAAIAVTVAKIVAKVNKVMSVVAAVYDLVLAGVATLQSLSARLTAETLPTLGNSAYDHQGV